MKFTIEVELRDETSKGRSITISEGGGYFDGMGMANMSGSCVSESAVREVLHNISNQIASEVGKAIKRRST